MMDWACFVTQDGVVHVGRGPFRQCAEAPAVGVGFYRNDFGLLEERPWWVPERVVEVGNLREIFGQGCEAGVLAWEEVEAGQFAEVFRAVTMAIAGGQLEKSVPVLTERGVWSGPPKAWSDFPKGLGKGMRLFGWGEGERGVLSATPEQLFSLEGGVLKTMALAGTARREDRDVFAVDEKEIREHEYVAQTLMAKLADFGMVRRKERQVMDLGSLIHFHTPIEVELHQAESPERLVRRLHPTPALGPLPRTRETLDWLLEWRVKLGCPGWFGAPFGFIKDGCFEALVGIRMVLWEGKAVMVPAGCGVIEPSRLVNEWRELRLKREAVKGIFGLLEMPH